MGKTEMTKTEQAIRQQLRDKFASEALNGLLASGATGEYSNLAYFAYKYADAMLKAREEDA
jgi:hypothetical protein